MEACRASVAEGMHQEDVTQPMDGVEVGSKAPSEPSVAPPEDEQPLTLPVMSSTDVTGQRQYKWPTDVIV